MLSCFFFTNLQTDNELEKGFVCVYSDDGLSVLGNQKAESVDFGKKSENDVITLFVAS